MEWVIMLKWHTAKQCNISLYHSYYGPYTAYVLTFSESS